MNEKPRFARKRIISAQLRASTGVRGVGGKRRDVTTVGRREVSSAAPPDFTGQPGKETRFGAACAHSWRENHGQGTVINVKEEGGVK